MVSSRQVSLKEETFCPPRIKDIVTEAKRLLPKELRCIGGLRAVSV